MVGGRIPLDTILTRDVWMHRVDLCHATGHPMTVTAAHDGVIVADVVAEWAGRHGEPYRLTLTGPAGGNYRPASDGAVDTNSTPSSSAGSCPAAAPHRLARDPQCHSE